MFGSRFCQMGWKPSLISPISSSSSSSSSSAYAALHNCRVEDVYRWWWLTYLLPTPHKQQIPSFCLCGSTPFFFYLVPSVKTEKELNRIIDVCDPYHFPNPPLFIHRSATGAAMGFRDPPILSNRCPLRCATTGLVDWRVAPPLEKRTTGEGGHVTRLEKKMLSILASRVDDRALGGFKYIGWRSSPFKERNNKRPSGRGLSSLWGSFK